MLRNVDIEDEENRSDTQSRSSASEVTTLWRYTNLFIIIIILISGRSGEPLTLNNAASNHVYVRPASQRRAVSPAALFSAAPDCR